MNQEQIKKEDWEKEFEGFWREQRVLFFSFVGANRKSKSYFKSFIRTLLTKTRKEERERILGEIEKMKTKKRKGKFLRNPLAENEYQDYYDGFNKALEALSKSLKEIKS